MVSPYLQFGGLGRVGQQTWQKKDRSSLTSRSKSLIQWETVSKDKVKLHSGRQPHQSLASIVQVCPHPQIHVRACGKWLLYVYSAMFKISREQNLLYWTLVLYLWLKEKERKEENSLARYIYTTRMLLWRTFWLFSL